MWLKYILKTVCDSLHGNHLICYFIFYFRNARIYDRIRFSNCWQRCEFHGSSKMTIINGSKFAALHWQYWRLRMSETFSSGTIKLIQTKNKQIGVGDRIFIQHWNKFKNKIVPFSLTFWKAWWTNWCKWCIVCTLVV